MSRLVSLVALVCLVIFGTINLAMAEQPGIRCVQNQLNALGFSLGTADGTIGGKTRAAAEEYRAWMSGGAGGEGWSQPPLTALNGEFWCEKVGQAHPEVAKYAVVASPPRYDVSPGEMLASFDVPTSGKIVKWKLSFGFKTQCENDHRIVLTSPNGSNVTVMERGLNRCSGRSEAFTGESNQDTGAFVGGNALGTWTLLFQDLDTNKYSGALTSARLELAVVEGDATTKYVAVLKGLPKKVPNPE